MINVMGILKNKTRCELSGNRVTSYGLEFGGGSINYWDGGWDNDDFLIPVQLENIFHNRDGGVKIFDFNGHLCEPRMYFHQWQPSHMETHFMLPHYLRVEQIRWIYDDVVCVRLHFIHSNQSSLPVKFSWNAELQNRETIQSKKGKSFAYRKDGRLGGVYRLFSYSNVNCKCRVVATNKKIDLEFDVKSGDSTIYFFWSLSEDFSDANVRMERCKADPELSLKKTKKRWTYFFDKQVPNIEGLPKWLERQYYSLFYSHKANEYSALGGNFKHAFTCPSKFRLLPQWFWDSAFHSIVEKWLYNFKPTHGSVLNILEAAEPDGHLPFCLHKNGYAFDKLAGFQVIQPWVLPIAVWEIFCHTGNIRWLKKTLPGIAAFDQWLENSRTSKNNLTYLRTAGESGWDNSARFINAVSDRAEVSADMSKINPIDFNSIILNSRQLTLQMASIAGNGALASKYQGYCKKMTSAIRKCWNSKLSSYVDCRIDGRLSNVLTPAGFVSMLPKIASKTQAEKMHTLLTNGSHFWTKYPLPTLTKQHKMYSSEDQYCSYWNGRTWPPVNWLVVEGLIKYGFNETARELIKRSIEMVSATGEPLSTENYHPEKAKKYEIAHNIFNYGWGGLPNDMLLKHILGIRPVIQNNSLNIEPLWLEQLDQVKVTNLHLGGSIFDIEYKKRKNSKMEISIKCSESDKYYLTNNALSKKLGKKTKKITYTKK